VGKINFWVFYRLRAIESENRVAENALDRAVVEHRRYTEEMVTRSFISW
jgi:hypothetical protein